MSFRFDFVFVQFPISAHPYALYGLYGKQYVAEEVRCTRL